MEVKVGNDIVYIPKFQKSFQRYPKKFRRDIFCESELKNQDTQHLAGIFSAKEAVVKALDLKASKWKLIEILNFDTGKPFVKLHKKISSHNIESSDISISHHGDYVTAVAVFLIK